MKHASIIKCRICGAQSLKGYAMDYYAKQYRNVPEFKNVVSPDGCSYLCWKCRSSGSALVLNQCNDIMAAWAGEKASQQLTMNLVWDGEQFTESR